MIKDQPRRISFAPNTKCWASCTAPRKRHRRTTRRIARIPRKLTFPNSSTRASERPTWRPASACSPAAPTPTSSIWYFLYILLILIQLQLSIILQEKGTTALHVAAGSGQASQIELLLIYGSDPGALDSFGKSPVDHARFTC